jgi:NAD(P)H-hydrate repair Nnr-like enzyme with NAD(P)H-hydrate dehydratase domain
VLAGLAGVLLAAGLDPLDAGSLAVVVHGQAGHEASAGGPVSAGALVDVVPATLARLLRGGSGRLGD